MDPREAAQRAAVVAEARSWIGTPYHHEARVKGRQGGVDCAQLLIGVFSAPGVGLIEPMSVPHYPPDWHLHRDAERYLGTVLQHAYEIPGPPLPGDVVVWRFGRCFSHGAIVIEWPLIVEARLGIGTVLTNIKVDKALAFIGERGPEQGRVRPKRFFSYWGA